MLVKELAKKIIEYHIEDDYQVYRLKHTPLRVRHLMTKRYKKKWENLPIEANKVVFDNYMGSGFGCNGKYITLKLLRECPNLDIVWTVRDVHLHRKEFPKGVRLVEYLSDDAFYEYATAKIWVSNIHLVPYLFKGLRKKDGQYYIQTWHGSLGIKKIENDSDLIRRAANWLVMAQLNSKMTDYWISNSQFETDVYHSAFWDPQNILEYGHPRNDILFSDSEKIKKKVRTRLNIPEEVKTILYVPTFRETADMEGFELDYNMLTDSLSERFGGQWKVIMRLHPKMRVKASQIIPQEVIDGSLYPDIQEMMVYTDAMITDYSSCIFDFILTNKPGFMFTIDADGYNTERGLYYSVYDTPFSVACNNDELRKNILEFDQKVYDRKVDDFLKEKGSIESGNASKQVAKLINTLIDKDIRRIKE